MGKIKADANSHRSNIIENVSLMLKSSYVLKFTSHDAINIQSIIIFLIDRTFTN